MIPLDVNAAPSTPKQPEISRLSDDSPQKVPHLLADDLRDDCRCCTPDTAAMTSARVARQGDKLRCAASLRPRVGRVQRSSGLASRRRRGRQPAARQCVETAAEPLDESTPCERNRADETYSVADIVTQPDDILRTIQLPFDPRQWSREEVQTWLRQMALDYHIAVTNDVIAERFPTNGKGLCLMLISPDMFIRRVPQGGHILFNDFRSRLLRAVTAGSTSGTTSCLPVRHVELTAAS